jgi:hypothetical protein
LFSTLSRGLISLLLTLTRLVVVFIFVNFSFALFTPPLGDYQLDFALKVILIPDINVTRTKCKTIARFSRHLPYKDLSDHTDKYEKNP